MSTETGLEKEAKGNTEMVIAKMDTPKYGETLCDT